MSAMTPLSVANKKLHVQMTESWRAVEALKMHYMKIQNVTLQDLK